MRLLLIVLVLVLIFSGGWGVRAGWYIGPPGTFVGGIGLVILIILIVVLLSY